MSAVAPAIIGQAAPDPIGRPQKLDQLTSLRFFAAAMIVFCHCNGLFGFSVSARLEGLAAGVSFFFVLSGFILAQVYPRLDSAAAVGHFLRARIARIWPAHVAAFLLAFWLLSLEWQTWPALLNLFLLQAWSQDPGVHFSYNSPAWTLSAEWFFYLVFPLLILSWRQTWLAKLLSCAFFVLAVVAYYSVAPPEGDAFPLLGLNPASRLLEFTLGIGMQSLWTSRVGQTRWNLGMATVLEIGAVALCVAYIWFVPEMYALAQGHDVAIVGAWLSFSGAMLPFAALILVLANGRGALSGLLAHPGLVLLGEISFSIYLLHQIGLRYYEANLASYSSLSDGAALGLYWVVLLLASYVMWAWLEMPMRRLIVHGGPIHGSAPMTNAWKSNAIFSPRARIAAVLLWGILYGLDAGLQPARDVAREQDDAVFASKSSSLLEASWNGDDKMVERLIARGADVNARLADGYTPLIAAATQQHASIVAILVRAGAQADLADHDGSTPLMISAWKGNRAVVETLLAAGADARRKRADGLDAFDLARIGLHPEIVALLSANSP